MNGGKQFIVCCNDVACFEFMRLGEGHDNETHMVFTREVKDPGNQDDAAVKEFIADEYAMAMYDYGCYLRYGGREWYRSEHGPGSFRPEARLSLLARKMGCAGKEAVSLVKEGTAIVGQAQNGNAFALDDLLSEKAGLFAEALLAAAHARWKIVSTFGYSGENGGFWRYMEQGFMRELARREKEHRGEYAVFAAGVSLSLF